MADAHGAAYARSPEVNGLSGDLPHWQDESYGGYGGYGGGPSHESTGDGNDDTDDIGSYSAIPRPVENQGRGGGFLTPEGQRGYAGGAGGWS
jgi:hypothetical protein